MITVCCFLWRGWRPLYDHTHVNALARMLINHLHLPHRLVCFTDMPDGVACETRPLPSRPVVKTIGNRPNCYRRLWLFSREALELGERVLSIGLDCVILRDLDPLLTEHDFRIIQGFTAPYNGDMWWLRTGTRTAAFEQFSERGIQQAAERTMPNGRKFEGSDQAWLGHVLPGEAVWTAADGVRLFHETRILKKPLTGEERIVFFPGLMKPWHLETQRYAPELYSTYNQFL